MLESLALHYSWYDFYDVLEKSFINGKNILTVYHSETSFYQVIKLLINFGTSTARSLLDHIWYLLGLQIGKTTINNKHCTKMKFSIKEFCSKSDQIRSFLRIWLHLLKKSLMKNFIFCTVKAGATAQIFVLDFVQKRFYSSSVVLKHILGTFSFLWLRY